MNNNLRVSLEYMLKYFGHDVRSDGLEKKFVWYGKWQER